MRLCHKPNFKALTEKLYLPLSTNHVNWATHLEVVLQMKGKGKLIAQPRSASKRNVKNLRATIIARETLFSLTI